MAQESYECPVCTFVSCNLDVLQNHLECQHFSQQNESTAAASLDSSIKEVFQCPLCSETLETLAELESHVDQTHVETPTESSASSLTCPVCQEGGFLSPESLSLHVDQHFNSSLAEPAVSSDVALAGEVERREREARELRERHEFQQLQAQYGFQPGRSIRQQGERALFSAVQRGHMSLVEYHEKRIRHSLAERGGVDDSSSATLDVLTVLRSLCSETPSVKRVHLASPMDHYASSHGDTGWGCGYRNLQMLLSCLLRNDVYLRQLRRFCDWTDGDVGGPVRVPSITRLQSAIEDAWKMGFDTQGAEQLGGKLTNTSKWIGATEVVALLSSCSIRCRLLDFHRPTSAEGTHPAMVGWVRQYFGVQTDFKAPLYFQHQGHSRIIVGTEELSEANTRLLVLDPHHSVDHMLQLYSNASSACGLKRIRKTAGSFKHAQYQIVCVEGLLDEQEYQASQVLRSTRIP